MEMSCPSSLQTGSPRNVSGMFSIAQKLETRNFAILWKVLSNTKPKPKQHVHLHSFIGNTLVKVSSQGHLKHTIVFQLPTTRALISMKAVRSSFFRKSLKDSDHNNWVTHFSRSTWKLKTAQKLKIKAAKNQKGRFTGFCRHLGIQFSSTSKNKITEMYIWNLSSLPFAHKEAPETQSKMRRLC